MSGSSATSRGRHGDEVPPEGGGVFRRMGAATAASGLGGMFGAVEAAFAPAASAARDELQRQKIAGQRDPSDTDPPDGPHDGEPVPRIIAPGRPGTPFSGAVVLQPAPRGGTTRHTDVSE